LKERGGGALSSGSAVGCQIKRRKKKRKEMGREKRKNEDILEFFSVAPGPGHKKTGWERGRKILGKRKEKVLNFRFLRSSRANAHRGE